MAAQFQIINKVLQTKDYSLIDKNNLTSDYFYTYKAEFNYIKDHYARYGTVPDVRTFKTVFEDFKIEAVAEPDSYLISEINKEYNAAVIAAKYNDIKESLESGDVDRAMALSAEVNAELKVCSAATSMDITSDFSRVDHYKDRANGNIANYYLTTGLDRLDAMIGGIDLKNENMVIVARTGVGKSWILLEMAAAAYSRGKNVGIFSGEMSEDKVAYRIDTILGHISNQGLNGGNPYVQAQTDNYIDHLKNGTWGEVVPNYIPGGHIHVLTPKMVGGSVTVDTLRAFVESENLDILFIDQYSLLDDTSRAKQTNEKVANISKAIKQLQVLTQKPMIAVSQMNRTGGKDEDGNDKEPDSTMIGLTDRIGQDATSLLYLSKKPLDDDGRVVKKQKANVQYTKYVFTITVGKARDGGEGKLSYAIDLDTFDCVPFDDAKAAKVEHENSFDDDDSADYENMSDDSWGE